jgi:DNA-binding MarR family transcriptional regulator
MKKYSIDEIFNLIDETQKKLEGIQRATMEGTGLTPSQYYILKLLWDQDNRPLKDFSAALHCSGATITGIVDTLEKNGLVSRVPNPSDRRSLLAALTKDGKTIQKKTTDLETIYNQCCNGLSEEEIQILGKLMEKLSTSLSCG